jgi:hypothetical protein
MSQMTSTARAGARALQRPITQTPRLRVVTGAPLQRGGPAFVLICATLLAAGLIGVLLLNTALAEGSFTLHSLRTTSDQLTDTQGAVSQSLEAAQAPANLAKRAADMGMVPAQSAAFLRLSDGKVIGVAQQASPGPGLTVVGAAPSASAAAVPRPASTTPVTTTPAKAATSGPAAAKSAKTAKTARTPKPAQTASAVVTAARPAKR